MEIQRAGGWAALRRGRETQRAAGFPSLQQGRETQRAAGFPNLRRGIKARRAAGYPSLERGLETNRMSNWECLRRGHETQRAAGFPTLQRGRETLRAAGFPTLKRANEKGSRILLDATDKEYGFQCVLGALPTSIEPRCGHDDCQQSLPPDLDPRYTSTGEYLAKVICKCWKNGHIAHSGCSHRSGLATPQDASTEYASWGGVVKKIK